jgi:hypothetical protein
MKRFVSNTEGPLPKQFYRAHDLCFCVHDILCQLLASGEELDVFRNQIPLIDETDRPDEEGGESLFLWLERTGRLTERAQVVRTLVLPALLSDMLHCIYEALEASRKGKLNVTYMLIRKPLQENLFLLEEIALDEVQFTEQMAEDPVVIQASNAGGLDKHRERVQQILDLLSLNEMFDAQYIAQLRYEKCEDGFDGICNKAMHLFTSHKKIKTEVMNINFIFSGDEAKLTQWSYLYGRLPYLLVYAWHLIEYITAKICLTPSAYHLDMVRRVAAGVVLSAGYASDLTSSLRKFYSAHGKYILTLKSLQTWEQLEDLAHSGKMPAGADTDGHPTKKPKKARVRKAPLSKGGLNV